MNTTPRKKPHKKPPLPLKKPKITFWKSILPEGSNEEALAMNVMQVLTSMDLNDKEAEKEILKVLQDHLNDYKKKPENEQDLEFKKKLEKDITIFQNYVNNQTGGKRRKKKTRKKKRRMKRGGCWPNCFKKKSNSNSGEFAKTKPPQQQEQEMPLIEQPNQQVRRRLLRIPSMATLSEGKEKVENWQRSRSTSPTMDPFTAAHHNLPRDHFAKVDQILEKAAKKGLGGGRRKTRKKKNRKRRTKKKSRKRKRRK